MHMPPNENFWCDLFGHKPSGVITGFRNEDKAVLSWCKRCGIPIVCNEWHAAKHVDKNIEGLTALQLDYVKTLRCLYIAVEASVADDVCARVGAYVRELEDRLGIKPPTQKEPKTCSQSNSETK